VRVAFATCATVRDGWPDDAPVAALLDADVRVWDDPAVDWAAYDRVIMRSTWDYMDRLDEFLAWCEAVGPRRLRNDPALVAFALDKRYLAELSVPTVPTTFVAPGDPSPALSGEVVVKPNVSAGARDTGRFGERAHALAQTLIERIQDSGRVALVQPYLSAVDARGETALVYFHGTLSHVLRKRALLAPDEVAPTAKDGLGEAAAMAQDLVVAATADAAELALAEQLLAEVEARFGRPLYARVDLVPGPDGEPLLLELEVAEPVLFLAAMPGAAERFAAAIRAS
jgi:hypothetical protein